jgi:Mce-associated membrane protein
MADDAAAPEGELNDATESSLEPTTESPERLQPTDTAHTDGTDVDEMPDEHPDDAEAAPVVRRRRTLSPVALATVLGLVSALALGVLVGWLGVRANQAHRAEQQRALFLQVGRQAAINLTSIDFERAEGDVQRILDSATDKFYDDFSNRSGPFVDVIKQAKSKSSGEVTAAGIETETDDSAEVLVAITVKTSNAGAAGQAPRAWRMRISVKKVEDGAKVSNVEFVP